MKTNKVSLKLKTRLECKLVYKALTDLKRKFIESGNITGFPDHDGYPETLEFYVSLVAIDKIQNEIEAALVKAGYDV